MRRQDVVYRLFDELEQISDFHFGPKYELVQNARAQINQVGSFVLKKRKGGEQTVVGVEVKQGTFSAQHTCCVVSRFSFYECVFLLGCCCAYDIMNLKFWSL